MSKWGKWTAAELIEMEDGHPPPKYSAADFLRQDKAAENAREILSHLGDRRRTLETWRSATPEQRQDIMAVAPAVANQFREQRGGAIERTAAALGKGVSGLAQPIMELVGAGGTEEEIQAIHWLEGLASQTFHPATPDDPWYARGPLNAVEMIPAMATMVGGGLAGKQLGGAAGLGSTGIRASEIAGVTAAGFPSQYAQELDSLKAAGVSDVWWREPVAALTATATSSIEAVVPNPFKVGNVPLTKGATAAAKAYLANALKQAPGELSEEYLQGLSSGLGRVIATHLDKNAPDQGLGSAFQEAWDQSKEAALPLAFMLGTPAVAGAGVSAVRANRMEQLKSVADKGFVSAKEAEDLGIFGANRRERWANLGKELGELEKEIKDAQVQEKQVAPEAADQEQVPAEPEKPVEQEPEVHEEMTSAEVEGQRGAVVARPVQKYPAEPDRSLKVILAEIPPGTPNRNRIARERQAEMASRSYSDRKPIDDAIAKERESLELRGYIGGGDRQEAFDAIAAALDRKLGSPRRSQSSEALYFDTNGRQIRLALHDMVYDRENIGVVIVPDGNESDFRIDSTTMFNPDLLAEEAIRIAEQSAREAADTTDYPGKTVKDLKADAKQRGLTGYSLKNKKALAEMLMADDAKKAGKTVVPKATSVPTESMTSGVEYPVAGDAVDGRTVRSGPVPNTESIAASLEDGYTVLPGIREVPMADFEITGKHYSVEGNRRIRELRDEIGRSGEVTPLIVVIDDQGPYILEGATRIEALYNLGAKSFPAIVVDNRATLQRATVELRSLEAPVPAESRVVEAEAPQPETPVAQPETPKRRGRKDAQQRKGTSPGGKAMAAMTQGDSYQPAQPESSTPSQLKKNPVPKAQTKEEAKKVVSDLVGMASPAHVSDVSRSAGHTMREEMARASQWDEASREALRRMENVFWSMSPKDSYDFIDRLEAGKSQATPELDEISTALRTELDKGRDRLRELGKLQDFYENYFPHLWKNPTHAQDTIRSISAGKPWRSGGFLKQRTHITHREGRDAGLVPITDNPVEMALLRLHQINKYVVRTNIMERLKQSGQMTFVPESLDTNYMPSGYEYYDDPAFRVVTDPSITMEEAYDKLLVDQLSAVLSRLGVRHERVAKMSHGKWGESKGKGIKTRFAGPVSVLAHELGHQIGDMWGLYDYLTKGAPVEGRNKSDSQRKRGQMQRELRSLADLRVEAQSGDVVERTKQYRRKKAEKEAVLLEAWLASPDKMAEVAPMVTKAWKAFLEANEPLKPLLTLDRSVVLGTREQTIPQRGVLHLGKWAMPRDIARMVKNMLSPGLRSNPNKPVKGVYRLARIAGNAMNQASLSLSAFHALNVLTDASASQIGIGIQQLERGRLGQAVWNIVTAPTAGVAGVIRGGNLIKAMRSDVDNLSPEMRSFVETSLAAGARASMDPVYHNFAMRELAKSFRKMRYGTALAKADAAVRLPAQMILGALEMTSKPILEWMVPRMKLAVFFNMSSDIQERAMQNDLTDFQVREQLSQAWDSVDNRLGQLAYDNLFWNQYLKDVSMLAVRSVGWNLGSFREYGGAILDVVQTQDRLRRGDQVISRKMGYAIGAVLTYAPLGMLMMYAFTGRRPDEPKDYFFPQTGRTNPDGSPERLSLPTYAKDWVAWTTQPGKVATHKLHPMWGTMAEIFENENFYGTKIREEDDPWFAQLGDVMRHGGEAFVPFSIKNMDRFLEAGEAPQIAIPMALSGITSAPAYISRSPASNLAHSFTIDNLPQGSRTKEQAEGSRMRKELVRRMRAGEDVTRDELTRYSKQQMKLIEKEANQTPFAVVVGRLSSDQAMKVWAIASDEEKNQIRQTLALRFINKATDQGASTIKELNDSKQAMVYLSTLGVSHEDAQQLLVESRRTRSSDGKIQTEYKGDSVEFDPSYFAKAQALAELYGEADPRAAVMEFRESRDFKAWDDRWRKDQK